MTFVGYDDAFVREALGLPGTSDRRYTAVCTDTRTLVPESLFVALAGERFDGHEMLDGARAAGAIGAVVRQGTPPVEGMTLYRVPDTLVSFGELACARRRTVPGPVVAITGQNGKTSTREMVAAVMGTRWLVHRTPQNLNNLVGVPQTILSAPPDTEALVIEAGASVPGEIARYRRIIEPDVSLVIAAGSGHLEGFGSVAGVVREKLELTRDVPLAIIGVVPEVLADGARRLGAGSAVTAGFPPAEVIPEQVELRPDGCATFTIDGFTVRLPVRGRHQVGNAMFAWALVRHFDLDREAAVAALEAVTLPGGRGELARHGAMTVLNDGYNANPESFRAAIELAGAMRTGRRLVFVAGTMRELGAESAVLHREIAGELAGLAPDLLVLVGDFVPAFEAIRGRYSGEIVGAADAGAAGPLLASRLRGDELVFLKGSRGTALERILPAIIPVALPD